MEKLNELSHMIIGGAIEVHRVLGPGMLESAYEECLGFELAHRGLWVDRQVGVPVVYKEVKLECGYRIDLLIDKKIVLELKSVDAILPVHEAQILTYMKFAGKKLGLLINFNVKILKDGISRFVL